LAARELIAEIVAPFGKPRKQLVDLGRRPAPGALDGGEVFLDGERFEDVALLRHPADAGMRALLGAQPRDIAAIELDGAAAVAGDTDDGIDQRGLAHSIATEQRQ